MPGQRPHDDQWPYSLPHGWDRGQEMSGAARKMALALVGHMTFNDYFETPFATILRRSKNILSPRIRKVNENCQVRLGSETSLQDQIESVARAIGDDRTMRNLLEHDLTPDIRREAELLDTMGISMHFTHVPDAAADPNNIKLRIRNVFSSGVPDHNRPLLTVLGSMTLEEFHSPRPHTRFRENYSAEEKALFEEIRTLGILSCYDPGRFAKGPISSFFVNNKCWNSNPTPPDLPGCIPHNFANCNGGPGPGTDNC